MSEHAVNADRLLYLAEIVCDDIASDEDFAELDSILLADDAHRRCYLDYHRMRVVLRLELRAQRAAQKVRERIDVDLAFPHPDESIVAASETPSTRPLGFLGAAIHGTVGYLPESLPFAYLVATVICGVGLLIGTLVHVSRPGQIATQPTLPSPSGRGARDEGSGSRDSSPHSVVGRITGMVDCQWADPATEAFNGVYVPLGRKYALSSGLLEITYDTGAKVILQGPVTYEVESAASGFLSVGKLTAKVEKKEERRTKNEELSASSSSFLIPHSYFAVRTPSATVTDLGTEFGVEVDKTGAVEAQVFDGAIQVAGLREDGNLGACQRVGQGEAVRIAPKGATVQRMTVQNGQFVRQLPRAGVICDDFDVTHNYLTSGATGSVWNGILHAKNASRLDTLPTEIGGVRLTGRLVIAVPKDANAGWAHDYAGSTFKSAPYLYVNVPAGDFEARVQINSLMDVPYSAGGLMARLDDDSFVSINRNRFTDTNNCYLSTRSESAGIDSHAWGAKAEGQCALRLVRMGEVFLASHSFDGGQTWTPMTWGDGLAVLHRPDLIGAMQVGLWYGTFSPAAGAATFEHFTVQAGSKHPPRAERK